MNYTLQLHNAKYVFPIPDGLKELSSDIIREVLRNQPEHINGFIADYLETMLQVRERARDAGMVVCDVFQEGWFYGELFRLKKVNREQANSYATVIQAAWRGYVVRRKIKEWFQKKKKFEEEQIKKREMRIEELLSGLGITYDEGKRAAGAIQAAYKEAKRGRWLTGELGEFWVPETVPFGERLREGDRALGRYDRWEKEDFGDFFEMTEVGAIKYVWPRIGQLRKVLRDDIPPDVPTVEFFAMRDLEGKEQYSYLIKTPLESEIRGTPIGFLIPMLKSQLEDIDYPEVTYISPHNQMKMDQYVYVFRDDVRREELQTLEDLLKSQQHSVISLYEMTGETESDYNFVAPRVLVRIKKEFLLESDDEVKFTVLPLNVTCEQEEYRFRAETLEQSLKIIRHIIRNKCLSVEEGLVEASNMKPYKFQETGRIFPVEKFKYPTYIQKIQITPESATADEEALDLMLYSYIFLTTEYQGVKPLPKGEPIFPISVIRFQGYHSDYKGSAGLEDKVFIMGPRVATPDGKPFTYESLFWDEFGEEAWHQLLCMDLEEAEEGEQGELLRVDEPDDGKDGQKQSGKTSESALTGLEPDGAAKPASVTQISEDEEEEGQGEGEQEEKDQEKKESSRRDEKLESEDNRKVIEEEGEVKEKSNELNWDVQKKFEEKEMMTPIASKDEEREKLGE